MSSSPANVEQRLGSPIGSVDALLEFVTEVGLGMIGTKHARPLWQATPGASRKLCVKLVDVTAQFPAIKFRNDDNVSVRREQLMVLIDGLLHNQHSFTLERVGGSSVLFTVESVQSKAEAAQHYVAQPREQILQQPPAKRQVSHWPDFWRATCGLAAAAVLAIAGIAIWYNW